MALLLHYFKSIEEKKKNTRILIGANIYFFHFAQTCSNFFDWPLHNYVCVCVSRVEEEEKN